MTEVEKLRAEVAAYKRAKGENDERFMLERDEARAEVERLTQLLSRIAGSACNYGSRVYRLTDDFAALRPYLTEEELARAEERPSRADERVAAERDSARADLALALARESAVVMLHFETPDCACPDAKTRCAECGEDWPCDTFIALRGQS